MLEAEFSSNLDKLRCAVSAVPIRAFHILSAPPDVTRSIRVTRWFTFISAAIVVMMYNHQKHHNFARFCPILMRFGADSMLKQVSR